jgi:hypothetical protein
MQTPGPAWNYSAPFEVDVGWAQYEVDAMQLGYMKPFSFRVGARSQPTITSVRHGVTEIRLSDGRLIRAMLHVGSLKPDPNKPSDVEISYSVVAEIMPAPETLIHDVHETVQ